MDARTCVLAAAAALEASERDTARVLLAELDGCLTPAGSAGARLHRLFGLGLRTRLDGGSGGGNAYALDPADGASMLAAFEVLRAQTPFVQFGHAAANAAIAALPAPSLHVVDIGIGRGSQWPALLETLARHDPPPGLRLTGVDLPAPGADPRRVLHEVGDELTGVAARLALPFSYQARAVPMEELHADHLDLRDDETLVVNLALALHHSPTDSTHGVSVRDQFLTRLREWAPALVTLTEPDAEHDRLPLTARVHEALTHYGALFDALAALVPDGDPARRVLEEQFFGREIVNVVGFDGVDRVERHQRHAAWGQRFHRAGFTPVDLTRHEELVRARADVREPTTLTADQGMLLLAWRGAPLLSVSAWTADGDHGAPPRSMHQDRSGVP
jgi:hypothetical protein